VADSDGECIGGMRRLGLGVELEKHRDHALHLVLVGATVAADALLDAGRCVFSALDAGGRGGDHRGASRLTDGQRDAGVGADERLLERDGVRRMLRYELHHSVEDRPQAQLRALACPGGPAPVAERADAPAAFEDDPVAARSRPWVDAEDLHDRRVGMVTDSPHPPLSGRGPTIARVRSLVLAALVALALPLLASAAVDKGTFTPGAGGAGITLGMTRAQVVSKLGKPLYANANGYLQYSSKSLFDIYLDGSNRVRLIGIAGPGFCTGFGACALEAGGIAKLRVRYGARLRLTKLPETGEQEWILLGTRGGRKVFTSFSPATSKAASAFIQVFIGYGNGL
jgi:hypothetical protein